ncbi:hypothetical protein EDD80_10235 [Anseongella ginsenosidimutans]|uniref:Uncharacterized protein n=1 Tax=Anseongella ginsenosidimutans TaxID=496056 RepID=A0A4R3KUA7_9SPHI|nr:hypothetical protein [Anseongella ginsenosidimutans]QEC51528.1 hypothetical protein FRZ59_03615 [Anseongella ginsenosidimutans]TCS88845.1 hypothetical protein EDD80_10235 [Anseongella ginsenosidimutans]
MDTGIKSGTSATIYILLGIIALLLAGNAYLFLTRDDAKSNLITIREEKAFLRQELNKLKTELDKVNSLNLDLSAELRTRQAQLKEKITQLQEALQNNKLTARQLQQAKSEVVGLRNYVGAYLAEIGSLKKQKSKLLAENEDLRSKVDVEQQRNRELATRNVELTEKISEAALLETEKVHIITFYSRMDDGREYEDQTSRAIRANKLRIEFSFYPNQVAEEGEREIYFRIFDPNGKLLEAIGNGTPAFNDPNGESVACTAKTTIFYSRANPVYAVELPRENNLEKGLYNVHLFTSGRRIGEGKFSLR